VRPLGEAASQPRLGDLPGIHGLGRAEGADAGSHGGGLEGVSHSAEEPGKDGARDGGSHLGDHRSPEADLSV